MRPRIPHTVTPAAILDAVRQAVRACRTYPARRRCPRFELDEAAARAFLHRALLRHACQLGEGEGDGAGKYENWELEPGWNLDTIYSDETDHIENLVYQAGREARVLSCTAGDVNIDLDIVAPPGGDWVYQWKVTFPGGAAYAICSHWEDLKHLGWHEDRLKAKGCRTAMGVLLEAEAIGNMLLNGHAAAAGRITGRRRPGRH